MMIAFSGYIGKKKDSEVDIFDVDTNKNNIIEIDLNFISSNFIKSCLKLILKLPLVNIYHCGSNSKDTLKYSDVFNAVAQLYIQQQNASF